MGIREQLGQKKTGGLFVAIVLVAFGAGAIAYQSVGGGGGATPASNTGDAYFSSDDGQSYFSDDSTKLAPFDYKGKTAVRAHVYRCGGKKFVGYLERYTPEGLKAQQTLNSAKDVKPGPNSPRIDAHTIQLANLGREIKRPGDKAWVPAVGAASGKILAVKCPGGSGDATPVEP